MEDDVSVQQTRQRSLSIEQQPLLSGTREELSRMSTDQKYSTLALVHAESPEPVCRTISSAPHRTYKRRWIGLAFVALLNFMSAFSIIIYAPVADNTKTYFKLTSLTPVNWIYISAMFVYVAVSPLSMWLTHRGAKITLITGASLLILGSWLRYIGARINSFSCVIVGSVFCGASQPFALNIATHYADLWFAHGSRVTATALMSLANPLGQAVASLVVPFMVSDAADIPNMSLYAAILFSVTTCLSIFTPTRPPTPVRAITITTKTDLGRVLPALVKSAEFRALFVQLSIYIALFNTLATLIEQITHPYGYSDVTAGILGAVQVVFGLLASLATAPILDKTKAYKLPISLAVLSQSIAYFALIFMIRQYNIGVLVGIVIFVAIIGAAGLVSLPLALELAADVTFPVRPEVTATILWMGGQLMSGIVIVVADALRSRDGIYTNSLIFMAIIAAIPLPFAYYLVTSKRVQICRDERNGVPGDMASHGNDTQHVDGS